MAQSEIQSDRRQKFHVSDYIELVETSSRQKPCTMRFKRTGVDGVFLSNYRFVAITF